jgi:hypothetical protein
MAQRRAKAVAKIQNLLGSEGTCRMYGFGVVGPEPRRSMFVIVGSVVAFCVGIAVLTGVVIFPGLLALYIVRWVVNTPRGVAIADQGVAVTSESMWNAKPTGIVARFPLEQIYAVAGQTTTHVCVQFGNDQVWLRRKEHEILVAAVQTVRMQSAPMQTG